MTEAELEREHDEWVRSHCYDDFGEPLYDWAVSAYKTTELRPHDGR